MPYLTNLAAVARRTGFPVVECPGWESRGHGPQPAVKGVVCHHTAGRADMHVVRDGRPGLDGPLSQFWLEHTGRIFVVAAGLCWHNAPSTSPNHTNSNSIGIEAENDGRSPWPDVQLDSYRRLCAEICREYGLPASAVKGHKEVQPGKPDPHSINMNAFRADVAELMSGVPHLKPSTPTEDAVKDLPLLKLGAGQGKESALCWDVKTMFYLLHARGFSVAGGVDDTVFSGPVEDALKAFQREKKLDDDGLCGQLSWAALLRVA